MERRCWRSAGEGPLRRYSMGDGHTICSPATFYLLHIVCVLIRSVQKLLFLIESFLLHFPCCAVAVALSVLHTLCAFAFVLSMNRTFC